MISNPLISVITATKNGGKFINKALTSVLDQNFSSYEHLVIDSCSSDNTKSILKKFPSVYHYIKKDKSSHHAINKGIKLSKGEIICFLNSDDWLEPDIFKKIEECYNKQISKNVFFRCKYNMHLNKKFHEYNGLNDLKQECMFGAPGFNSFFFCKEIFKKNILKTQFNYAADREFLLRILRKFKCVRLNEISYNYRIHEDSRTLSGKNRNKILLEHLIISKNLKNDLEFKQINSVWFIKEFVKLIFKKKKQYVFFMLCKKFKLRLIFYFSFFLKIKLCQYGNIISKVFNDLIKFRIGY